MERWWRLDTPNLTLGLDLGDRQMDAFAVDERGEVVSRESLRLGKATAKQLAERFEQAGHWRVVMEAGTASPWVSRIFEEAGAETLVANPSELYGNKRRKRKNDELDAEHLARLGRADPALLHPIRHRSETTQTDLALIKSREVLVAQRTQAVNHVRGLVKSFGKRLPKCSTQTFTRKVREEIPGELWPAVGPILETIDELNARVKGFDRVIEELAEAKYAEETARVGQVSGVGTLTALSYTLVLEDPARFPRSRSVGQYLGLCPRLDDSGDSKPQLPIHKAGDELLRRLLVQSAQYILGPFGPDTDLRRWGLKLAERGGKNAKKRAVVAVARKLAVLMHRLWVTGEPYEPLRNANQADEAASVANAA